MMTIADVEDVAVKNKVMNLRGYQNREKLAKKTRQYRSRQGRSDESYINSMKVIAIAALFGVGMILAYYLAAFISGIANV